MYALSISQPWAWCIVHGPKRIENRSHPSVAGAARNLIGKQLALHAAKSWDPNASDRMRDQGLLVPMRVALPAGAIVGVCTISRVFQWDRDVGVIDAGDYKLPENQEAWTFGPWCIELADVRALDTPVIASGMPGFWFPSYAIEQLVLAQLGEVARG